MNEEQMIGFLRNIIIFLIMMICDGLIHWDFNDRKKKGIEEED